MTMPSQYKILSSNSNGQITDERIELLPRLVVAVGHRVDKSHQLCGTVLGMALLVTFYLLILTERSLISALSFCRVLLLL
jgi:hypothetical protein